MTISTHTASEQVQQQTTQDANPVWSLKKKIVHIPVQHLIRIMSDVCFGLELFFCLRSTNNTSKHFVCEAFGLSNMIKMMNVIMLSSFRVEHMQQIVSSHNLRGSDFVGFLFQAFVICVNADSCSFLICLLSGKEKLKCLPD